MNWTWEIELVKGVQRIGTAFLDVLFYGVTFLGDELLFLLVTCVLFWCVEKRYALRFAVVYLWGMMVNGILKSVIRRPRPFHNGAQSVFERTQGYSFPSGHAQSAAQIATLLSLRARPPQRRWLVPLLSAGVLLVAFSRIYLGQHYLTDVLAGIAFGVVLMLLLSWLLRKLRAHEEIIPLFLIPVLLLGMLVLRKEDLFTAAGAYTALTAGYHFEKRFVRFDPAGTGLFHAVKITLGAAVLLPLHYGFSLVLPGNLFMRFLGYFILGITVVVGLPLLFKWLRRASPRFYRPDATTAAAEANNDHAAESAAMKEGGNHHADV